MDLIPPVSELPDETAVEARKGSSRGALARGACVGRYVVLDALGEGGMGVVYKAYDPELDRTIALKLLHTTSTGLGERLMREAQALARLQHPNVIAVHDVGMVDGDVFIAMEFVAGRNLRQWLKERKRSVPEILDAFLGAGEGLAAAHRAGLIHRDFKPENVVVDGDGRARVLDFGLARAARMDPAAAAAESASSEIASTPTPSEAEKTLDARPSGTSSRPVRATPEPPAAPSDSGRISAGLLHSPLTRAGSIVGTPRFMAPEQHLGDNVDERADQFSFCVSLYWALYDTFPFADEAHEDPIDAVLAGKLVPPPPSSTVPRWLRQVIVRGLERQPADRHPSMAALLTALRADPHAVRRRWLRVALAGLIVAAVISIVAAAGLTLRARRTATNQARLAQQFGQEVERIGAISRYASSLPLHDTRNETDAIVQRMDRLKGQMRALGPIAAGPGHEALGRGDLALDRDTDALSELEAAWATGYRSPELAYALGLAHGKLYQRALADLPRSGDAKLDAARREAIARAHRDPALRYLKEAEVKEGGVDAPEYVEGLIALYEQRFDEALTLAHKTAARVLWQYEGRTLEGDVQLMAAEDRYAKGDVNGALAHYGPSGEAYRAATEVARSGFAARVGECRRRLHIANIATQRGQSPEADVKAAVAPCEAASTARPDQAVPLALLARSWWQLAEHQREHGVDPTNAAEETIRLGERALARDPGMAQARISIGWAHLTLGEYKMAKGSDPGPELWRAIDHGQRALEHDRGTESLGMLSRSYDTLGQNEQTKGGDPRPFYKGAIERSQQLTGLEPKGFLGWNNLGYSLHSLGSWEMSHGLDPTQAFTRAIAAFQKVAEIGPALDYGFINQCMVFLGWAEYLRHRGEDPRARLDQAIATCGHALERDRTYGGTYSDLAFAHKELAVWQLEHGVDPTAELAESSRALDRALALDPVLSDALGNVAHVHLVEASWAVAQRRDPTTAFAQAEAAGERELALADGQSADALQTLAEIHRRRAEWRAAHHLSVAADVRAGLAMAARALERNRQLAPAAGEAGALHLVAARAATTAAERTTAAEEARAALEKALAIDGNLEGEYRPLVAEAIRLTAR